MEKFNRNSMEKIVYDKIKNAIVSKNLVPGTQLIEQTLSEKLNVSRTPIRNAFKRLEQEGFITIIPNRGAFIIQPKKEEILDAFAIRIELEILALKFSIDKIDKCDIECLELLNKREIEALENNNIIEYLDVNKAFHLYLAKRSNNKFLLEFLDKILDQIDVYLLLYDTYYNVSIDDISGIKEHKKLIKLLKEKDIDVLEDYFRFHLKNSLDDIEVDKIVYKSIENVF